MKNFEIKIRLTFEKFYRPLKYSWFCNKYKEWNLAFGFIHIQIRQNLK